MFDRFDNSFRVARPVQQQALAWLEANWHKSNMFVLNLPTGIGKSAILRAIQEEFPHSHGIIPTNALMDQYLASYPSANFLKGLDHYRCSVRKGSCKENRESGGYCTDECDSQQSLVKARAGEPTLFNPLSYYYNRIEAPSVIVVDEAHTLPDLLMLLLDLSFRMSELGLKKTPDTLAEVISLVEKVRLGVQEEIDEQRDKSRTGNTVALKRLYSRRASLIELIGAMRSDPQDFVFYTEKRTFRKRSENYLIIKPIKCPKKFLDACLNGQKIVLLSATILKSDPEALGYSNYLYFDSDSPIPVEQRRMLYRPGPRSFNYQTHPEHVARWIRDILTAYPGRNALVHVSYAWQAKLKQYFPGSLVNTSTNKTEILQEFRQNGGLWLAAGCSEGIDLPDDQCRLVIIPMILRPNIMDPVVKKKLTTSLGPFHYEMDLVKSVIQQAGRAVRNQEDHAVTVIGDHGFPTLVMKNKDMIPKSFLKAIVWRI